MQQKQKFNNKGDLSFCFGKNTTFMKAANAHLFFNIDDFIQMVNAHDNQIAMVDMAPDFGNRQLISDILTFVY